MKLHTLPEPGGELPMVVTPESTREASNVALLHWLAESTSLIRRRLEQHGAILFRGFQVHDEAAFAAIAQALVGDLRAYVGGDSPRESSVSFTHSSRSCPLASSSRPS